MIFYQIQVYFVEKKSVICFERMMQNSLRLNAVIFFVPNRPEKLNYTTLY